MVNESQSLRRVQQGLQHLQSGLAPFVLRTLQSRFGDEWQQAVNRCVSSYRSGPLDAYAQLRTIIGCWPEAFRDAFDAGDRNRVRSLVTLALEARNQTAHAVGGLSDAAAMRALDAMHELLRLTAAPPDDVHAVKTLYDEQRRGPAPKAADVGRVSTARQGTHSERLLNHIRQNPGLDDDELSLRLDIRPRQSVNMIVRRLEQEGLIERVRGPRGKIVNRPTGRTTN